MTRGGAPRRASNTRHAAARRAGRPTSPNTIQYRRAPPDTAASPRSPPPIAARSGPEPRPADDTPRSRPTHRPRAPSSELRTPNSEPRAPSPELRAPARQRGRKPETRDVVTGTGSMSPVSCATRTAFPMP
ncbi:conserved hypothetical protein [Burkholderia pseudomallei 576]|nr:conserved hypothetical protein [Burkholderia pseudomallei 576]